MSVTRKFLPLNFLWSPIPSWGPLRPKPIAWGYMGYQDICQVGAAAKPPSGPCKVCLHRFEVQQEKADQLHHKDARRSVVPATFMPQPKTWAATVLGMVERCFHHIGSTPYDKIKSANLLSHQKGQLHAQHPKKHQAWHIMCWKLFVIRIGMKIRKWLLCFRAATSITSQSWPFLFQELERIQKQAQEERGAQHTTRGLKGFAETGRHTRAPPI